MSVYYCSQTNDTLFTECCNAAICDDEKKCPVCKKIIDLSPRQRDRIAMEKLYGKERYAEMKREWEQTRLKDIELRKRIYGDE